VRGGRGRGGGSGGGGRAPREARADGMRAHLGWVRTRDAHAEAVLRRDALGEVHARPARRAQVRRLGFGRRCGRRGGAQRHLRCISVWRGGSRRDGWSGRARRVGHRRHASRIWRRRRAASRIWRRRRAARFSGRRRRVAVCRRRWVGWRWARRVRLEWQGGPDGVLAEEEGVELVTHVGELVPAVEREGGGWRVVRVEGSETREGGTELVAGNACRSGRNDAFGARVRSRRDLSYR
jgi:hypothetical protein